MRQIVASEHRRVERRHPVKDRRPVLAQHAADRRRRRPLGHQHAGGADRQRKGQCIAEPIGEEQLCRREHDIPLVDAEHRDGIELRRLHQARMDMHGALRPSRRPRRVEPEAWLVRMGRRGVGRRRHLGKQPGERVILHVAAGNDQRRSRSWQRGQCRIHNRQQRRGDDDGAGAAVSRHEGKFRGRELRVDRDRHGPGLDRAEKGGRKVYSVMEAQKNALLRMNAEPAHEIGKPAHSFGELGIAVMPAVVDKSSLCATPGSEVSLDQVGCGIVSRRALTAHPPSSGP